MSDLRANLANLTARALTGEWPSETDLRNQILRCWKGAAFEPPAAGGSTFGDPRAIGIQVDAASGSGETVSATTMSEPTTTTAADACSMKRRHAVFSRKGEACPACGWTKPEAGA